MVNKIMPLFILIFIEPSRSLHYKFQHFPLNRDENWDVTEGDPHLLSLIETHSVVYMVSLGIPMGDYMGHSRRSEREKLT